MEAHSIEATVATAGTRHWIPFRIRRATVLQVLLGATLLGAAVLRLWLAATLPLTEPTEGRYAQMALEMASSGDWVTPRVWSNGDLVPFLGKPPLFIWTAAASIRAFGPTEFAVRLPSLCAAAALLVLMASVARWYLGRDTAIAAVLITSTCLLFYGATATVIYDLHFSFFIAGALLAHLAFALEKDPASQRRWSLLIFVLLAGGFLTKGPVALVLFGLPVLIWTAIRRKWDLAARHAWLPGLTLFLVIVGPWFVLAELRHPGFLHYFLINENLLRYLVSDYGDLYGSGHQYPRGTAAVMFLIATLPWSPVAIWLMIKGRARGLRRVIGDDVSLFFFLSFFANVLFWCFARQLIVTYLLPTIPLFAVWLAHTLVRNDLRRPKLLALAALAAVVCAVAVAAAGSLASRNAPRTALLEARRIASRAGLENHIIVAGRLPFSARFYLTEGMTHTPGESLHSTIVGVLESASPGMLVIRGPDIETIPADYRHRLQALTDEGAWFFLVLR